MLGERAAEVVLSQTLDQSAPFGSLLGNVGRGDGLHGKSGRALQPDLLTQGLSNADNIHATVIAVLLRRARLLHKPFSPSTEEGLELAGDAPRVQRIAAILRVVVCKMFGVLMVEQEAPVGPSGCLVGVVING